MKVLKGKKREQMQNNITTDIVSTLEKTKKSSEKNHNYFNFLFQNKLKDPAIFTENKCPTCPCYFILFLISKKEGVLNHTF